MAELVRWKDVDLIIKSEYTEKHLWVTASIDVLLSGNTLLSTGGQLKHKGSLSGQFNHDGTSHQLKLDWGPFVFHSVPCVLYIDDQEVARRNIKPENGLPHTISIIFLSIGLFTCLAFGMLMCVTLGRFVVAVIRILMSGI